MVIGFTYILTRYTIRTGHTTVFEISKRNIKMLFVYFSGHQKYNLCLFALLRGDQTQIKYYTYIYNTMLRNRYVLLGLFLDPAMGVLYL